MPLRNFSLSKIKQLRASTGSPIAECKKALEDHDGDIEKAKEWLREQGSVYADKRTERETSQGQIACKLDAHHQKAFLIELNCETDFVAKTDVFKNGVQAYLAALEHFDGFHNDFSNAHSDEAREKFLQLQLESSLDPDLTQMSASEALTFIISKTRENCNIRWFSWIGFFNFTGYFGTKAKN